MKIKPCKYCGKENHLSLNCYFKPRKLPNKRGKVSFNRQYTRKLWIDQNPGPWECYLQITPMCPRILDKQQMTIDHVEPAGSNPHKTYDLANYRPACIFCNGLKGSRSLQSLAKEYPKLKLS